MAFTLIAHAHLFTSKGEGVDATRRSQGKELAVDGSAMEVRRNEP